jgi:RNA polymerase sigma factor (sigma-70 family)
MDKRDVSPEDFQQLLNWLGPDPQKAGEKYESIRRGLTTLFDNWHCAEPDHLADETINRVLIKVRNIAATYSGDPALYFYGTAKNVRHEHLRRPRPEPLMPDIRIAANQDNEEKERLHACLDKCLDSLSGADKELILEYYRAEKKVKIVNRRELGERVGVSSNALRVRIFRLREQLEKCICRCLEAPRRSNKLSRTSLYVGGSH